MIHVVQPSYFADRETEDLGRKIFFKFIAELGHHTARSLQCCQFSSELQGFIVNSTRGTESLLDST